MRIRWFSLLVLMAGLLVGVGLQAAPGEQTLQPPQFARTRPVRIPRRAPNRESGFNNPGGLSSCNTSNSDTAIYDGDDTIYADGFPAESWVLGIVSPQGDLSDEEHISFWVQSDRNGVVAFDDLSDIRSAGANPTYTILIGSNGRIRGLCLQTVFDAYGFRPTSLYEEYLSEYPITDAADTAPPPSSPGDVLVPSESIGLSPFGDSQAGFQDVFYMGDGVIYAIDRNGDLWWYRHDGWQTGEASWAQVDGNPYVKVSEGWAGFQDVFAAGDGVIYAIESDGDLLWFRNDCWYDGGACWQGPGVRVGVSWDIYKDVFPGEQGVMYGIEPDGELWWYRNDGWQSGEERWALIDGNPYARMGEGWSGFQSVFSAGDGVTYAIESDGDLLWFRNDCWYDGGACWQGAGIRVGVSWNQFKNVFAGEQGVIYGISPNGDLWWYRNDGWQSGEERWAQIDGNPYVLVGKSW